MPGQQRLRAQCPTCFVAGLSMGGDIALYLASRAATAGAIALSPAIRVRDWRLRLSPLARYSRFWVEPGTENDDLADPQARALTWHYTRYPVAATSQLYALIRATRHSVRRIHVPTLIIQSLRDGSLIPEGAQWAYDRIPAPDRSLVWLKRSGHNILVDVEREEVFAQVHRFIVRVTGSPA